jgi:MazG family protein
MADAGDRFDELVRIMATLRGPEGCPWDREQTLGSLRPFLLEETYEALAALDHGDMAGLREELGDLLFEIVFLARVAEEDGHFTVADAAADVGAKLVRRHPHVFGDEPRLTKAGEVIGKWEEMKAKEAGSSRSDGSSGSSESKRRKTLLSGVPVTLPALLRAYEYGSRAAAVGFDWARAADVVEKIDEEAREIRELVDQVGQVDQVVPVARIEEEVGDLLFAIANLARKLGVEAETALRKANDKFTKRFTAMERSIAASERAMRDMTLEQLESAWQSAKSQE